MRKCIIIGAADFTLPKHICEGDLIIAADGGYDRAVAANITPSLFIGDMDSLGSALPENIEKITFPERKDYTDMHLSYLEGKKRGFKSFEIYGGTGGRADHTFANISLLLAIAKDKNRANMIAEGQTYTVIHEDEITLSGNPGEYVSVFAIGDRAEGVTLQGLDYEIENATLTPDFPLGVSNRFTDSEARISVRKGALLIIYQNNMI